MKGILRSALAFAVLGVTAAQTPLTVTVEAASSGGLRPYILGHTNRPDGTPLIVSLQPPREPNAAQRLAAGIPACSPNCLGAEGQTTVDGGEFEVGPFGPPETGLNPGTYLLEITSPTADSQPSSVRKIIGDHGQWLMGPYVIELMPEAGRTVDHMSRITVP